MNTQVVMFIIMLVCLSSILGGTNGCPIARRRRRGTTATTMIPTSRATLKISGRRLSSQCMTNTNTRKGKKCRRLKRLDEALQKHFLYNGSYEKSLSMLQGRMKNMSVSKRGLLDFLTNISVVLYKAEMTHVDGLEFVKLLGSLSRVVSRGLGRPRKKRDGFEVSAYYMAFSVWNVETDNFTGYTFPNISNLSNNTYGVGDQSIMLPSRIFSFTEKNNNSYAQITSTCYKPLEQMIIDASVRNSTLGSMSIVSTSIEPKIVKPLPKDEGIRITFYLFSDQNNQSLEALQPECVYWDYTLSSWSNKGCYLVESNETHAQCECSHLTDFSILMSTKELDVEEVHHEGLQLITVIGCCISTLFLLVMVVTISCIKRLRGNHRYLIHSNLAIALIVGNTCLLLSDAAKGDQRSTCISVSVVTFFFYLAAFFWMLCEGVFIWRALVTVFTENDKFKWYMLIGWGPPVVVVGVTVLVQRSSFVSDDVCWLSADNYTIYAFIGPAVAVVLVDVGILIVALIITAKHSKEVHKNGMKSMARLTILLLPLFGMTWMLGVFALSNELIVFKYLFTVLNSLQGFFIFLFYICCSKEVRMEIFTRSPQNVSFKRRQHSNTTTSETICEIK